MKMKDIPKKEYVRIHQWIKYHYGKADKCENIHCGKGWIKPIYIRGKVIEPYISENPLKKYTWALIKGKKYEKNINNFVKLCYQCHSKYDRGELKMDIKPTKDHHKYISIRASKTLQKYINELCNFYGEYKSKLLTRLIIEAHSKIKGKE